MKLCTFYEGENKRVGVKAENGIVDITALGFPSEMNNIIADQTILGKIALSIAGAPVIKEAGLRFGNISNPAKIVCGGLNYKDHATETGGTAPTQPVFFAKFNDTLHPANEPVKLPPWQRCFDYEVELIVVVGKRAYNISEEDAFEHIFGFACGNDLSARDAQFLSTQWHPGKSFPGFGPAGPYIVTRDELDPDNDELRISCYRNGVLVQDSNTRHMIISCRQMLASASRFFALAPGDLIFTGTPSGVILGKTKGTRDWLTPGETVTSYVEGIGELVTPLI